MLPEELYQTITKYMPIVCVDIIPVRRRVNTWEIGIITRATGSQAGKPALLGGRIRYGETVHEAIIRHIQTDWGIESFEYFEGSNEFQPFHVQQYLHADAALGPFGFDPTKQAIALNFLVQLEYEPTPRNEASNFYWVSSDAIPHPAAYNQDKVMATAFEYLSALMDS